MSTDAAFATLGIVVGSHPRDITRAFRSLSRESHPDTGGDPLRFTAIVTAYRALQNAGMVYADGPTPALASQRPQPWREQPASRRAEPRVESYYRRFLHGMDRLVGQPDLPTGPIRTTDRPMTVVSTPDRFAELLDRELLRVG